MPQTVALYTAALLHANLCSKYKMIGIIRKIGDEDESEPDSFQWHPQHQEALPAARRWSRQKCGFTHLSS